MIRLYVVWPENCGDWSYALLNDDGFGMASHYCSNYGFANSDLIEGRPERLEKWKEYLKDGYTLEYVYRGSQKHAELLEKNKVFANDEAMEKYAREVLKETPEINK